MELRFGGRTEARVAWVRDKMSNVNARDFEDVVKRWRVREVERLETFLRLGP